MIRNPVIFIYEQLTEHETIWTRLNHDEHEDTIKPDEHEDNGKLKSELNKISTM